MGWRRRSSAGGGRPAWPALLVVLAMLLQGLIPGAAVAASIAHDHPEQVQICTSTGLKTLSLGHDADHHGFGGLACEQCVMASLAAVAVAAPQALPPTTRVLLVQLPQRERPSVRTRAPPRPPSRGPPAQA
jgi:hypothetical protein